MSSTSIQLTGKILIEILYIESTNVQTIQQLLYISMPLA